MPLPENFKYNPRGSAEWAIVKRVPHHIQKPGFIPFIPLNDAINTIVQRYELLMLQSGLPTFSTTLLLIVADVLRTEEGKRLYANLPFDLKGLPDDLAVLIEPADADFASVVEGLDLLQAMSLIEQAEDAARLRDAKESARQILPKLRPTPILEAS